MDFDLGQVRAFVAAAEEGHFGRAAARLFLTQQALSKRIKRLELMLGTALFDRGPAGVALSEAGRRFLPHASGLLLAAESAAAAVGVPGRPLRVDVGGQAWRPLRIIRRLVAERPELLIDVSMRRSMTANLDALDRNQLDAGFGRVHDLDTAWPAALSSRPVMFERLAAAVPAGHRLADAESLRPHDLRGSPVWMPAGGSPAELLGLYRRYADRFRLTLDTDGMNLGLEEAISRLRQGPDRLMLLGEEWQLPPGCGVRLVPLTPAPCYLWSLVWRRADRQPLLSLLHTLIAAAARREGWLRHHPDRDWLPDVDLAGLDGQG